MKTITHDLRDTLEGKEIEIYALLCENLANSEISRRIEMPVATVCWHLRNIYRKLGVECTSGNEERQSVRRRAILYAGTRLEQTVTYGESKEKTFTLKEIRNAAKKTGCSITQTEDLVSFLEME